MNNCFKEKYDVIIIGASLSGLSAALTLGTKRFDILILEQHNLPGGVATSYVREGVELEASLHEMMGIGSKENPLAVRKFFDENNININWLETDEAFNLVTPNLNVSIKTGKDGNFTRCIQSILEETNNLDDIELKKKLESFFALCRDISNDVDGLLGIDLDKKKLLSTHPKYYLTLGSTALEVINSFKFPKSIVDILSAYWIYLGSPLNELPFTIYATVLNGYLGYGIYVPEHTSFEMSSKMAKKVEEAGIQIEYGVKVDKILIENNCVKGVRLLDGTEILCDYVISGAYANTVYQSMLEPKPDKINELIKINNSHEMSLTCFSVLLVLDKKPEELNINHYVTFYSVNDFDSKQQFDKLARLKDWDYLTSACTSILEDDPKNTIYSINVLPQISAFDDVDVFAYYKIKNELAHYLIELESKRLGVNLFDYIISIEIETPVAVNQYTGAYKGAIYGYRHTMKDHFVARSLVGGENIIDGLFFSGSQQLIGDGMAPAIYNGRIAAKELVGLYIKRRRSKRWLKLSHF